ncbi:MAG TPA: type II secretion system F family protein [Tepidisphaeraceae bacterium]|nr:type II secretion system F family protein [Tepidisphaeraceae bacterium]
MIEYANSSTPEPFIWTPFRVLGFVGSAIAWAGIALFFMLLVGGLFAIFVRPFGFLTPLLSFTLILLLASTVRDTRRRRALSALVYLEQAVRLNLPLTPLLASARLSERPGVARRLLHLEELLLAGSSVADAVDASLPELPPRTRRNIRSAERLGRLPTSLSRASRHDPSTPQFHDPTIVFYRSYPLLLIATISVVLVMLSIFVMPRFQDIFRDFGIPLPAITVTLMSFTNVLGPIVAALSLLLIFILAGRALWDVFVPRRPRIATRWFIDPLEWTFARRSALDRGLADICNLLADAAEAGLPLTTALAESEHLDLNHFLRRRIEHWRRLLDTGSSLPDSARAAHLPPILVGLLDTTPADLAAVLRFLSRYHAGRFSRTQALLRAAVVPAIAFTMGILVAIVALGLFVPLISLINAVSAPQHRSLL